MSYLIQANWKVCVVIYVYIIFWWLMNTHQFNGLHVTHISGNFCGRQSAYQVVAPSSSTSRGVRHLACNPCYYGLSMLSPFFNLEFGTPEKHSCHWGKHCTPNIPSAVYLTTAFREHMWDTPGFKTGFFHANLIRECLVSFLSREIWTTAYGRL